MVKKTFSRVVKFGLPIICSGFVILSCNKESNDVKGINKGHSKTMSAVSSIYSGKEIFQGIVFLDGPVVNNLEDFKDYNIVALTNDENKILAVKEFQQRVMSQIEKNEPAYFEAFKEQVQSADIGLIHTAIQDASSKVLNSAAALSGLTPKQLTDNAGVVAQTFSRKYAVDNSMSKDVMLQAVKAEISTSGCIVLYCNVVLWPMPLLNIGSGTYITQNTHQFNTYESDRFFSTIALNLAR